MINEKDGKSFTIPPWRHFRSLLSSLFKLKSKTGFICICDFICAVIVAQSIVIF